MADAISHTPGPWCHFPCYRARLPNESAGTDDFYVRGAKRGDNDVALVHHSYAKDTGNAVANARLIAAAPDLLAACRALVDSLNNDLSEEQCEAWDAAVAAIAKAEAK